MISNEEKGQFEAFSPRIVTTLILNGERLNVRSTCETSISVETDQCFAPSDATLEMVIGDTLDVTEVRLLDGIDPTRDDQPIRILSES